MKTCSTCKKELSLDLFDKQTTGKQGRRADCKECKKRFTRSKRGIAKSIYATQVASAKRRKYLPPTYSEDDLYQWLKALPNFHEIFEGWVDSGYLTRFRPSVDRKDDYISYTLDNIELVTWNENNQKGYSSKITGDNNKKNLAVDMLDMDGKFLERFYSVSEAARRFNGVPSNIVGAINNRVSTRKLPDGTTRKSISTQAYGHKWRYSMCPNSNQEMTL